MTTINCRGRLLDLSKPCVMGILNVTPDSFYDGGTYDQVNKALEHATMMIQQGASILDIGGMSSRPGAEIITIKEELRRVIPVIEALNDDQVLISIDTVHAEVARDAISAGAHIVNDISGGQISSNMYKLCGMEQVPYIMMHMQGKPKNMQAKPTYPGGVAIDIMKYFIENLRKCEKVGLHDVIIDPGFGFGKTMEHNYQLLSKMHTFKILERPLLAGISRKSMIGKVIGKPPIKGLAGTITANTLALEQGANILRVHDVAEAVDTIRIWQAFRDNKEEH